MGNTLEPGIHPAYHGNQRPSRICSLSAKNQVVWRTDSISDMENGVKRRPSCILRWLPCEILFFRITLVLNNLATHKVGVYTSIFRDKEFIYDILVTQELSFYHI